MVKLYFSLPYALMVLCLIIRRDNLTFYIYLYEHMKITVVCYVRSCILVDILTNLLEKSAASNQTVS
jgi:hypothetical protein